MIDKEWAADLNQAALAYDDHSGPTIEYPGLRISTAVLARPEPVLAITVQTRDAVRDQSQPAPKPLPAHIPVELFRDDDLLHCDAPPPRPGGLDTNRPHRRPTGGRLRRRRAAVRARAARLAWRIIARLTPDERRYHALEWAYRVNHAALAYNFDDAGPTIEYPGVRIFVYLTAGGALAINVWTKDTDEDSSLATPDDLPAHIPVELHRDDQLIHRDAPIPFGEQA